jgi:hypothetical protein
MNECSPQHRGFFTAEAIIGLALLAMIMILLAVALGREQKVMNRLADSRAALRLAEETLTALQSKTAAPQAGVRVMKLDAPCDAPGCSWAKVQATVNGRSATLIGVVPSASLPPGGAP